MGRFFHVTTIESRLFRFLFFSFLKHYNVILGFGWISILSLDRNLQ